MGITFVEFDLSRICRQRGYAVHSNAEDGQIELKFAKKSASGYFRAGYDHDGKLRMFFQYSNRFKRNNDPENELKRYRGVNNFSDICGKEFKITFREPNVLYIMTARDITCSEDNIEMQAERCLSVAESSYTYLDSEEYYVNQLTGKLLEKEFTGKLKSRKAWKDSEELPAVIKKAR